jgi:hypothetical protein
MSTGWWDVCRVTRLGQVSPIGRLFTLGSYFFIADVHSPQIWSTFFHGKGEALILTKNVLGYILGEFFQKLNWSPWWEDAFTPTSIDREKKQEQKKIF